jgi:MbtH protein
MTETDDTRIYDVVINHEEQYSIWLADRDVPTGWQRTGFSGAKQACLDHIAEVWTDMRPLSLRRRLASPSVPVDPSRGSSATTGEEVQ